ncbi:MAG: plasmid pRiA4b ORF-3 family protein, partial [Dermatophilaceae bacterium]
MAQSLIDPVAQARTALEAEIVLSHVIGVVREGVEGDAEDVEHAVALLLHELVAPLEAVGSAGALAVLRLLGVYGVERSRALAADAAGRLAGSGVDDAPWAGRVGRPEFLRAWRSSDLFGAQDSVGVQFTDRGRDHTLMLLVDHDLGGGLKDAWVAEGREARALRQRVIDSLAAEPALELADLDLTEAARALRDAVASPPCPVEPDQVEDLAAHLELVRVRSRHLCDLAGIEPAVLPTAAPTAGPAVAARLPGPVGAVPPPGPAGTVPPPGPAGAVPPPGPAGTGLLPIELDAGRSTSVAPRRRSQGRATGDSPPGPATGDGTVLRLKVTLDGIRPPVWRRLEVPAGILLSDLHEVLQVAFDWEHAHLHCFETLPPRGGVAGSRGGRRHPRGQVLEDDELERVRLADVAGATGDRLLYRYDFGDDWEHLIEVEAVEDAAPGARYPRCTGGRRAAPPEDCGGVPGYHGLLDALADP